MTTARDEPRERRARRAAERQGLRASKTRRFDPLATDFGTWSIFDGDRLLIGPVSLGEAERWLSTPRDQRRRH